MLRPAAASQAADLRRQAQREKQLAKLAKDQQALQTWMRRLKRAFHAIERIQGRITRLQRQVGPAERRLATLRPLVAPVRPAVSTRWQMPHSAPVSFREYLMTLADSLREYIEACFTGLWIESHEHDDALAEIAQLCQRREVAAGHLGPRPGAAARRRRAAADAASQRSAGRHPLAQRPGAAETARRCWCW